VGGVNCASLTVTASGVSTSNTGSLTCYGSFILASGTVWNATSTISLYSTGTSTLTTNGVTLPGVTISNNGYYNLGSALTCSILTITGFGSLDTTASNYAITCLNLRSTSNIGVKLYKFNGSTVTITGSNSNTLNQTTGTNINAGTSTIIFTGSSSPSGAVWPQSGSTFTLYNVIMAGTSTFLTFSLQGTNMVVNNLTINGGTTSGTRFFRIQPTIVGGTFTINGALNVGTGAANESCRHSISFSGNSTTTGLATIICNGSLALTNMDFFSVAAGGSVGSWTGTSISTSGSSTGITATAPKTVYWNLPAGGAWYGSNAYAASSGGAVSFTNFPLMQDTVIIDNTGISAASNIALSGYIGTFDGSAVTNAITISGSAVFYGDLKTSSSMTIGGATWSIVKPVPAGIQKITSNGATLPTLYITGGILQATVQLQGAVTATSVSHTDGTLDLNNYTLTLTLSGYTSNGSVSTRTLAFGTGNITITTNSGWNNTYGTGFIATGSRTVNMSYSGSTTSNLVMGPVSEVNTISLNFTTGTYALVFTSYDAINDLNFTGFSGAVQIWPYGIKVYGSYTASATMGYSGGSVALTFAASTGTKTITFAGVTPAFPIIFNGYAGTWALQDTLTQSTVFSYQTVTLNAGTLQIKAGTTLTTNAFIVSDPIYGEITQKYLQSTVPGSQATLSMVSMAYPIDALTVKDNIVSPARTAGGYSVNAGNNTNWTFSTATPRTSGNFLNFL
jgi:hypothetical protein